jgi:AcrR family transcriptional regulator
VTDRVLKREAKKRRIIEAAARVFARKGYAGTVMADIAEGAQIGKGTLYEYFRSKEALFFSVFEWYVDKSRAEAKVNLAALGTSASERLRLCSRTLLTAWGDLRDIYSLTMEFWAASTSSLLKDRFKQAFRNGYREYRALLAALIREGIARGEFREDLPVESVAAALVGMWDALLLQAWFDDDFDPASMSDGFMDAVLNGLRNTETQCEEMRNF